MGGDRPRGLRDLRDLLNAIGEPVSTLELAEMLWLAGHLPPPSGMQATAAEPSDAAPPRDTEGAAAPAELPDGEDVPAAAGDSAGGSPGQPVYAPGDPAAGGSGGAAASLLVPTAPMLNQTLAVQRALRPFKRRVLARHRSRLDERATAEQVARRPWQRPWIPVMVPSRERWLSVALVVDAGSGMDVWGPLAGELREALFRLGAFRDVRLWLVDPDLGPPGTIGVRASAGGPVQAPSALADPTGRQAVIVLSDCSGRHWWDGRAGAAAHLWARHSPAAILQPLGEELWRRTGAPTVPGQATLSRPGAPNTELRFTPHDGPVRQRAGDIAIPVVELSADWLGDWAKLVAGAGGPRDTAVTYVRERAQSGAAPVAAETVLAPEERVRRFQDAASPLAAELAARAAVAVPYLPVLRLIQHRILPASRPSHLAEVLLSGLLRPVDGRPGLFDFVPGALEALLRTLPHEESLATAEVLELISAEIDERAGSAAQTFRAVMNVADGSEDAGAADGGGRAFALISRQALGLLTHAAAPAADGEASTGGVALAGSGRPGGAAEAGGAGDAARGDDADEAARADGADEVALRDAASEDPQGEMGEEPRQDERGLFLSAIIDGQRYALHLPERLPEPDWPTPLPDSAGPLGDLVRILTYLDPSSRPRLPILIEGPPGSGKTWLAIRTAFAAADNGWFRGGVLYARISVNATPEEIAEHLVRAIAPSAPGLPADAIPESAGDRFRLFRAALAHYGSVGREVLLIVDDQSADVEILRALLPDDDRTGTLVISRDRLGITPAYIVKPSAADEPAAAAAPELPPGPRSAMVIATGRYQDMRLPTLRSAVREAHELAGVLGDPAIGGFTVTEFYDMPLADLRGAIDAFLRERRPDETVLIYLGGYALADAQGNLLFAAADTDTDRPQDTGLAAAELSAVLGRCRARQQVVMLDFSSGTVTRLPDFNANRTFDVYGGNREGLDILVGWPPTASRKPREPNPALPFTVALTEGLHTGAADMRGNGLITGRDVFHYIVTYHEPLRVDHSMQYEANAVIARRSGRGTSAKPPMSPAARTSPLAGFTSMVLNRSAGLSTVAFSPDGRRLAWGGHMVHLLDASTGRLVGSPLDTGEKVHGIAFSPDGRQLAIGHEGGLSLWDVPTGRQVSQLAPTESIRAVAFSPDGTLLASAGEAVQVWDLSGSVLIPIRFGSVSPASDVAFSSDGSFLAIVLGGGTVHMRRAGLGEAFAPVWSAHGDTASVAFSPDGALLASVERYEAKLRDAATGEFIIIGYRSSTGLNRGAFSPDGTLLAIGADDGTIRVLAVPSVFEQFTLSGHTSPVRAVAFSPDGLTIASASAGGTVRLWR